MSEKRIFEVLGDWNLLILQEMSRGIFEVRVTGGFTWGGKVRSFDTEPEARQYAGELQEMFPQHIELFVEGKTQVVDLRKLTHISEAFYLVPGSGLVHINFVDGEYKFVTQLDCVTTLPDAAKNCRLAYSTLAERVRDKRLKARKIGGTWITTRQAVCRCVYKENQDALDNEDADTLREMANF